MARVRGRRSPTLSSLDSEMRKVFPLMQSAWALTPVFASFAIAANAPVIAAAPKPPAHVGTPVKTASAPPSAAPTPPRTPQQSNDPCGGSTRLLASLDRPTIGFSTCTVPAGSAILEEGYQLNTQGGASASVSATYPQGFQRYGLVPHFEIDLIGPNFNRSRDPAGITTGFSDLGIGFKFQLPQRTKVQYAIDGLFTAATGAGAFTAGGPTQQLNLDIAYPLSVNVGIGTTLGVASASGARMNGSAIRPRYARYGAFIPSLVVTDQINHSTQFYAEYVNPTKIAPDLGGRSMTDFGVQQLFGQYVEIDTEYGISFTPIQGSRFRYIGLGLGLWIK